MSRDLNAAIHVLDKLGADVCDLGGAVVVFEKTAGIEDDFSHAFVFPRGVESHVDI